MSFEYVIEHLHKDIETYEGMIKGNYIPIGNIEQLKRCRDRIAELERAIYILEQSEAK